MLLPEMLLGISRARKHRRLLAFFHARLVDGRIARLLLPLFHRRWIADVLDLALEIQKTHPSAKALFVQLSDRRLVGVMIRRPEQNAAETMPRHGRVVPLWRFALNRFDRIKSIEVRAECTALDSRPVERNRTVTNLIEHLICV